MGRTIPFHFRVVFTMEEIAEWKKPFHNTLEKSDRKKSLIRKRLTLQGFTSRRGGGKSTSVSKFSL